MSMKRVSALLLVVAVAFVATVLRRSAPVQAASPAVIEITADKDNRFKMPGLKKPLITAHSKQVLRLRITAHKAQESEKDGTVHGFCIKQLKDEGWNLRLKEGTQEFTLVAPEQPGEYVIECTIKCGDGHDDMRMKLVVLP